MGHRTASHLETVYIVGATFRVERNLDTRLANPLFKMANAQIYTGELQRFRFFQVHSEKNHSDMVLLTGRSPGERLNGLDADAILQSQLQISNLAMYSDSFDWPKRPSSYFERRLFFCWSPDVSP